MALPHIFGPQTGNIALSQLDDNFSQLGLQCIYPCTVTGTNALTVTPASGAPAISSYFNNLVCVFVAAATSTAIVTLNVSGLGAANLYLPDAVTLAGSGALTINKPYVAMYVSTIPGFVLTYPGTAGLTVLPRSYLAGLTLSNDGTSPNTVLDISAGQCVDSTNSANINLGAFTKATGGSWVTGTGSNGMGQGLTIAATTWYHVYAIINGAVADVYFDTSPSGANAPTGTTAFRRIGSFRTDGSAHIIAFVQDGDRFEWAAPVTDYNQSNFGTSAQLLTMTVPSGVHVLWIGNVHILDPGAVMIIYVSDPATNDVAPTIVSATAPGSTLINDSTVGDNSAFISVRTNTSSQIRTRTNLGGATSSQRIFTVAWNDPRGRNS